MVLGVFPNDCVDVLEAFQKYQDSNEWAPKPLNVKAVVAEIRLTVQYFSQKRLWPFWVLQPTDRLVRRIPEDDDAYEDYGNENWEVLVNVMNLPSVMESVCFQEAFNDVSNAVYGDRVNRSSVGSYNFRGNVVERLLTFLLKQTRKEPREASAMAAQG